VVRNDARDCHQCLGGYRNPREAQVKVRFQTWHWGERPWVNALEAFQQDFNKANPGIEIVRDESRYNDKEAVYITTSLAKAAADIAHFDHRPIRQFAERGFLLDLDPFVEKEGGQKFLAQFDQAALEVCRHKGKLYCLPDFVNPMGDQPPGGRHVAQALAWK